MDLFSAGGLFVAVIMYAISVSPSLLPRRGFWHGLVSGTLMGAGYALGWIGQNLLTYAAHRLGFRVELSETAQIWVPTIFWVAVGLWFLRSVIGSYLSSRRAARLVEMRPESWREYLLGLLITLVFFAALVGVARAGAWVYTQLIHWLGQWMYEPLAGLLAATVLVVLALFVSNKVVLGGFLMFFAREAERRNNRTAAGVHEPVVAERSGSPTSLCSWESVGAQGRTFLGRGPHRHRIGQVMGETALEPIRVYAGLVPGSVDFAEEAALVVQEMHRTGALDREVVLISVATGSGWVDEWIVQSMEYLTRGNCATISMQYSYLFSAAIALTQKELCLRSAEVLFAAVRAEIDQLPPERRPKLIISGESLGAEAAQAPFLNFADMRGRVDGALLVGAPYRARISRELTQGRHRGSAEVAPVYDSGKHARFVNEPGQLDRDLFGREFGPWEHPRIIFAQHASDPVVWFNRTVAFREPDWLRERVGLDVSPNMRFTPLVTLVQLIGDLPIAGTVPGGHGHTYTEELLPSWARILDLDVSPELLARIGRAIRSDVESSGRR